LDRIELSEKVKDCIQKFKYPLLILALGIVLVLLSPLNDGNEKMPVLSAEQENILSVEDQLAMILSSVKGAGKVQVMLSISKGEETLYQMNEDKSLNDNNTSANSDTVTVTDSDRNENGWIRQVNPPVYSGAVVVCEGADNPQVKLSIIDAVGKLTGLGSDKISVIKMK
jgi:stage III sporulation protein AG